jgi:molybdopterin synthase catalytic subunit
MKNVEVLFFATLKERFGQNRICLSLNDESTVADLKKRLSEMKPLASATIDRALVSINQEFAFLEDDIPPDAVVALFPPVSGGGELPTVVAVTATTIGLDDLLARITLPTTGAACLFTGMVRGETVRDNPHQTVYLEYEAYTPMAEVKMRQVVEEIRHRWPAVEGIAVIQRVGHLDPMTPTVLIGCTAAHRDTGVFEAARYGIDRLKEIVPVWKKEVGPGGEEWVEGEYIPTRND